MARQRRFIDTNVYEESKNRIRHIMDTHDHINVAFSGGKDSDIAVKPLTSVNKNVAVFFSPPSFKSSGLSCNCLTCLGSR